MPPKKTKQTAPADDSDEKSTPPQNFFVDNKEWRESKIDMLLSGDKIVKIIKDIKACQIVEISGEHFGLVKMQDLTELMVETLNHLDSAEKAIDVLANHLKQ